jgi:hypothetical protein
LPLEQLDHTCKVARAAHTAVVVVAASMVVAVAVQLEVMVAQVVAVHRIQRMPHLPL